MPPREVKRTPCFERVADLPRRTPDLSDAKAWAKVLTQELLCAGVKGAELRPWQAYGIKEFVENEGLFAVLPVGFGKTLLAEMLASISRAQRPMLIIPASLRDKTLHDRRSFVGTWRMGNPPPRITTLQELAPEKGADLLDRFSPDLVIIDECDELANFESSAARRLDRYRWAKGDDVMFAAFTGTPTRNSIMAYWHIVRWCLGTGAPVPEKRSEARLWAAAIDNVRGDPNGPRRVRPGPLGATREHAREWYSQRLCDTPGVLIIDGDSCTTKLHIELRPAKEDPVLDDLFRTFLLQDTEAANVPDGLIVSDPLSRWRIDGFLGCGLIQRYVAPGPPQEYRDARLCSARFTRDAIRASTHASKPLDTEAQVMRAFPEAPAVVEWLRYKDDFYPVEAVWFTSSTIQTAVAWIAEDPRPGIVWCGNVEFAEALARVTGLSYYGAKGQDQNGRGLHQADTSRSMIVSWNANKRGFNLQAWRRFALFHPPQSAKYLEQVFGRPHRAGQDEDVYGTVFCTSGGTYDAFDAAMSEARFARATTRTTQKILRANVTRRYPLKTAGNKYRWATRDERDD